MEKTDFVKLHEKSTSNYSYVWKLEHTAASLKEWALLAGQNIFEFETITFDTGILQKTKHSIKAYFIIGTGEMIVKLRLGTPALFGHYTHSISVECVYLTIACPGSDLSFNQDFIKATKEKLEEFSLQTTFDEPDMTETVWYSETFVGQSTRCTMDVTFKLENAYWSETINTKSSGEQVSVFNESTPWTTLDTKTLFNSKQFADFVIHCDGSKFQVHKMVLASRSSVFAAMFEQPLVETLEGEMIISDFEPNVVEEFLKFLYTGNADFENCASKLLLLAEKYCVDHLKQLSEQYLINSVNVNNSMDLCNLGKLVNSEKLTDKCMETLKRHKKELFKTPDDAVAFLRDFPYAHDVIFE